jgi:excisionase family DNA binding protein
VTPYETPYVTTSEAAVVAEVSRSTILRARRAGHLRAVTRHARRGFIFSRQSLDWWLDDRARDARPPGSTSTVDSSTR